MQFELTGIVRRTVEEEYVVTVEAESQDEAADLVYAILSVFPNSELSGARLLCVRRDTVDEPIVEDIDTQNYDVANDVEDLDDYS